MSDNDESYNSSPEEEYESDNYETSSTNNSTNKVYHTKNGKRVELQDGEVPEVLKEPILFKAKKNKDEEKKINFNKPKDQMVLIEDKETPELTEAENMLQRYEDPFIQFKKSKKKPDPIKLSGWETEYEEIFKIIRNKVDTIIPIINFSTIHEFDNISKLSTLCNSFRKFNNNTILTFSGDFSNGGKFYETSFKGRHLIHLFNQLKVDFVTLNEDDLLNDQLNSRISEFTGTTILSNVENENTKIPGTFKYVIRKVTDTSNFENKICFMGFSKSDKFDTFDISSTSSKILESKADKIDISIALSALDFEENLKIKNVALILGKSNKINLSSEYKKIKIITSDPNLNSISLSILHFPKGSKKYTLQTYIIPLSEIPDDSNFLVHQNYWQDLGFAELKNKYNFDLTKIFKNHNLRSKAFLKFIIESLSKFKDIGYVILDPDLFVELKANLKATDIFKLFPEEHKLVKFKIQEPELLHKIIKDQRIVYSKINDSNIVLTTKDIAESIIAEYFDEFEVQIVGDIKTVIYENL